MPVIKWFKKPGLNAGATLEMIDKLKDLSSACNIRSLQTEHCFYVDCNLSKVLTREEEDTLKWVLDVPFEEGLARKSSFSTGTKCNQLLIEIGPRLNYSTPFSTNAVSIFQNLGLNSLSRIEHSTRYLVTFDGENGGDGCRITSNLERDIVNALHDKMTQCRYLQPIESFELETQPDTVQDVNVIGEGRAALEKANTELGLAFDEWDLTHYTDLFKNNFKRNPTSVECFDLAQSNSEHSRHWFFKGRMVVDGKECDDSLFQMVMSTQDCSHKNNVIKFNDNSSGIEGYKVSVLHPEYPSAPSVFKKRQNALRHIIFTAETHNFPTGVAPFPGATTGTGGRIRDVQATGKGAYVIAGIAGYSFGNLHIPGYRLPWENKQFEYPSNFALPVEVIIGASNGASDYGNKFGEPVLTGFSRSFGMLMPGGERKEYVKPIMFSAGIGSLEDIHLIKDEPQKGMQVVKVGGPVYRIGLGGGAASSIHVQGDNASELDYGAVQRGDAEMEQKMNRVIRACIEMGERNPIRSIHDQGAGGNGNVLKEISEPAGSLIRTSGFQLGDPTLSVLELWGAEYQESNALLVRQQDQLVLEEISEREKCAVCFVGEITGDGKIKLEDDRSLIDIDSDSDGEPQSKRTKTTESPYPVDLDLELVLGKMPRKVFKLNHVQQILQALSLPNELSVMEGLERVLRLPTVASKRYLTNKVDRSVTGLVAQQQCVGPLHTPLADVAVVALSHFGIVGAASAVGEQPIKGLVDPSAGARMTVGEALTNLVFARISDLKDVKCSGNWMWAAKLEGEGALLVDTCTAMCEVMRSLGVAVDGGKDSLSMAARVKGDTVKAPGTLVVSVYAPCPDITATVTPDLKCPNGQGKLIYVPFSPGHCRLGGSALAQCYGQIGNCAPDMDDVNLFSTAFKTTQHLLSGGKLESGHDVSDGGLLTCILEMAFAGNCGITVNIPKLSDAATVMEALFSEELGIIVEVSNENLDHVVQTYTDAGVAVYNLGSSSGQGPSAMVKVSVEGEEVLEEKTNVVRDIWEQTSFQLDRLQTNKQCVEREEAGLKRRLQPPYKLTFKPQTPVHSNGGQSKPRVAVIREEGSNGDREMVTAFYMAGFEVWDVNMKDLCSGNVTLDSFRGVAFVGGFSYADVFGSAKGWAATIRYNQAAQRQFDSFYQREDTFSLGVCNGCQLMALLGWVGIDEEAEQDKENSQVGSQGIHLTHNKSGRFESRFSTVKIQSSPAIMMKGMEGSVLGIWVAHGEGQVVFKNDEIQTSVLSQKLVPLTYVDDQGESTTEYPLNPNGSPNGIAAMCSPDGRHLAMMPHPERCVLPWQWPWMPEEWRNSISTSPWLKMFTNAYQWCAQ